MFSGIIQSMGTIISVTEQGGGKEIVIDPKLKRNWKIGESVMLSGVCSTVTHVDKNQLTFFYMPETLKKTTAAHWKKNDKINIEPSLAIGDELSGHLVFGHVDGCAAIEKIEPDGESKVFWFRAPEGMSKYLVPKGSVALDGTSLTVVDVDGDIFSVSFIPFTLEHTNFGNYSKNDEVNFEADMLAKYIAKLVTPYIK